MRLRDYTAPDRAACLAVFDSNVPEFFTEPERAEFAAFLDDLPGPYLVLEDENGRVAGCGGYALAPGTTTADLCWGMVRRERHGTGLGRRLLKVRLERIRADAAATEVQLSTIPATVAFFERFGFQFVRVKPDGVAPGLDRCDMRLLLEGREQRAP